MVLVDEQQNLVHFTLAVLLLSLFIRRAQMHSLGPVQLGPHLKISRMGFVHEIPTINKKIRSSLKQSSNLIKFWLATPV